MKHLLKRYLKHCIVNSGGFLLAAFVSGIVTSFLLSKGQGWFLGSIITFTFAIIFVPLFAVGNQKHCVDELLDPGHDNDYSVDQKNDFTIDASLEVVKEKIDEIIKESNYELIEERIEGDVDKFSYISNAKKNIFGKQRKTLRDHVFISLRCIIRDSVEVEIHSKALSKFVYFDDARNLERVLAFEKELKSIV